MFKAACCGLALGLLGSSTRIGIGAAACVTPHKATPRTDCLVKEPIMRAKKVGALSVTVTLINAVGAMLVGGAVTPDTVAGKSTKTLLPKAELPLATVAGYPFSAA